ncbi:MAG: GNAT family N-acetyltransferase [Rubrivivax sp.]|nr:GNAT family N-acetyltransferase [Rubrivivax sp.]
MGTAAPRSAYRPRRLRLRDGREVTLRGIAESDAPAIARAFEQLSPDSRYQRFMQHKKQLNPEALDRGVHRRPGEDFAFVAVVPGAEGTAGMEIVGAAQFVLSGDGDPGLCEFAITLAEGWRGLGLATQLMRSLLRRARYDGYAAMEGLVLATNEPMLALARKLGFSVEPVPPDGTVVRVLRRLQPAPPLEPADPP